MRVIVKVEQMKLTEERENVLRNNFEYTYDLYSNSVCIRYDDSNLVKNEWILSNFPNEYSRMRRDMNEQEKEKPQQ